MRRTKLSATDQAKAIREITRHVRETTSEVSEQDVDEKRLVVETTVNQIKHEIKTA